jgi:glycosyltransferase involved in cell wall biosynthesis
MAYNLIVLYLISYSLMKLTLIITTYNWPKALFLVLESVKNQTLVPDEIIIADDGSSSETKTSINEFISNNDLNLIHIWQKDIGFRVARSRNNALKNSTGDYIVLIDGDVVLHKNFIQDHLVNSEFGYFVQGSRVLINEVESKKILSGKNMSFNFFSSGIKNRKNSIRSKLLSTLFSNKKNHIQGIKSCNLAFFREDCMNVNGFNNDFKGWGREDSEFVVRLINNGLKRKNLRFNAIQFHLWHNENNRQMLNKNNLLLEKAINDSLVRCDNGIDRVNDYES